MRKIITFLSVMILWILLPAGAMALSRETGTIRTTVPTEHSVSIEAQHASALYLEGTKGESDAYVVPRFSEPSFQLSVEKGWMLERVLLNDQDVTNQVTQGVLKLPSVCGDQVIILETKSISPDTSKPEDGNNNSTADGTAESGPLQNTGGTTEDSSGLRAPGTGDGSVLWYTLFLISAGALITVIFCRSRKNSR